MYKTEIAILLNTITRLRKLVVKFKPVIFSNKRKKIWFKFLDTYNTNKKPYWFI